MSQLQDLVQDFKERGLLLPIWFEGRSLKLIDQIKLPLSEEVCRVDRVSDLAMAIKNMTIRGSGAIGTCGAWGLYLAAVQSEGKKEDVQEAARQLKQTRPTAVNLSKTIDEMLGAASGSDGVSLIVNLENKAVEILSRQLEFEYRLGEHGAALIEDGDRILTHCHSGALAGSGYGGRALSVIRKAHENGKRIHVFTSETRPYLQGARITAYELKKFGIPHTLLTDGMSGYCMSQGMIDKVVVGSDRVASNGDLANKVGTYMHALAAREHDVPFYTATSSHTVDFDCPRGQDIEVEYRDSREVTSFLSIRTSPKGTKALYPSFDITPHSMISGIITEKGVIQAPYSTNLQKLNHAPVS
ncbi:S-methyl-5-thioribose-1-phosphate isomerase [Fictibacillus sp. WQ 8-8]|uniref:S-methyl-5-thioribose-1-phosphate isomerase n=1 Tax=Fictibacillus sp. WQ 8-8 TaxID=2938788 RepID=UPI00210C9DEA|nr:S-methyl-5-thioribose-1-phosphate isomerase [Fictibacillus sp. WQ 8-8]MCQ6268119.1 S-methyl-5-thioribose-1-phosphate isomerase [Fictibacillus sp. WQ 8-8]